MSNSKKKLRLGVIIALTAFVLFISIILTLLYGVSHANDDLKTYIRPVKNDSSTEYYLDNETGYWTFIKDDVKDFKILQLTDIHIGAGLFTHKKDLYALNAVKSLIEYTKPDLIILTGDLVYPIPLFGSMDNLAPTKLLAEFVDSFEIPWTLVYGNHDCESYSMRQKSEISDYYLSDELNFCIFQRGPDDIFGEGNTVINLKNSRDGEVNTSLILIDSNMYYTGVVSNYDTIHQDQVDWYKDTVLELSEGHSKGVVPSLAFFHIPVCEYEDAWEAYLNADPDAIYHYGGCYEYTYQYMVGSPSRDIYTGIFDIMLELGSTKGCFVGHDHRNNFSITYKGIRLTYGMTIDFNAYARDMHEPTRGGTLITIDENSEFEVMPIQLDSVTVAGAYK